MSASRWSITPLLFYLFSSATSSPVSISTFAPPLPSQISPPSPLPTLHPSLPSPSLSVSPPVPLLTINQADGTEQAQCPLTMSPSTLVVRYGDPVKANCSLQRSGFPVLGWVVSMGAPNPTDGHFLVWSVDRMTEWSLTPMCWALSEQGGQCVVKLPLLVFKPPDNVSISLLNHTGPMLEGHEYVLQCEVQDVAPVENLRVTFYRGQTVLVQTWSGNNETKQPVTQIVTWDITPSEEEDGAEYWCEATLDLGPEGPPHPPVVRSQKLPTMVLFGPQIDCPPKLQVKEGESVGCEVRGNPPPSVTWFRDGHAVALPTHSNMKHAGYYTVSAKGLGEKNLTVELEVLPGNGAANSCNRYFLTAVLLIQTILLL
ncbi:uncharacterized protein LOC117816131 [Notolabrus celidotus]|uniref:uncharacterized protein LOC117816131 n=1 Tax=Notolabrus celidotus TaxID=1203425 RepID=UPI00148F8F73|nr:uncharacterized protein LOC117816131 [Notolabrus celidotus]